MSLSKQEQDHLFRLLTDNANILAKVIPNIPLLDYIITGNTTLANSSEVIKAYDAWKNKN